MRKEAGTGKKIIILQSQVDDGKGGQCIHCDKWFRNKTDIGLSHSGYVGMLKPIHREVVK